MNKKEMEKQIRKETIKQLILDYCLDYADLSSSLYGEKRESCLSLASEIYRESDQKIIAFWKERMKEKENDL